MKSYRVIAPTRRRILFRSQHVFPKYGLIEKVGDELLELKPKKIVLSGPSGFLGSRVLNSILSVQAFRKKYALDPGELILLSSGPGRLMSHLTQRYSRSTLSHVRASRVDYYTQHDVETWRDHLGSLGLKGSDSVFVNLAAVAGPQKGRVDAMLDVNYKAPVAAAKACEYLEFGHLVQSSTQATNAERAGQVPYSRGKAMADFAMSNMQGLPVTIALLGLLYSREDGLVGQTGSNLNLVDLCKLPITPIMGDGSAPLQPLEVSDAAERIAYLALSEPSMRPIQHRSYRSERDAGVSQLRTYTLRVYDAVGPETMSFLNMLRTIAVAHGNQNFRPVFIDYRNMELLLNIQSLGNMNRQFVSLLRSEQDTDKPIIGDPAVWTSILGHNATLCTLDESFAHASSRRFPVQNFIQWVLRNPKVIGPGVAVLLEAMRSAAKNYKPPSIINKSH